PPDATVACYGTTVGLRRRPSSRARTPRDHGHIHHERVTCVPHRCENAASLATAISSQGRACHRPFSLTRGGPIMPRSPGGEGASGTAGMTTCRAARVCLPRQRLALVLPSPNVLLTSQRGDSSPCSSRGARHRVLGGFEPPAGREQ